MNKGLTLFHAITVLGTKYGLFDHVVRRAKKIPIDQLMTQSGK